MDEKPILVHLEETARLEIERVLFLQNFRTMIIFLGAPRRQHCLRSLAHTTACLCGEKRRLTDATENNRIKEKEEEKKGRRRRRRAGGDGWKRKHKKSLGGPAWRLESREKINNVRTRFFALSLPCRPLTLSVRVRSSRIFRPGYRTNQSFDDSVRKKSNQIRESNTL